MYVTPEQVLAANKAGVEALLSIANTQFAAFERLSALQFNATKAAFEDSVSLTKSLLAAKDAELRYLFANRYHARLFGLGNQAVLGRTAAELLGPLYHLTESCGRTCSKLRSMTCRLFWPSSIIIPMKI